MSGEKSPVERFWEDVPREYVRSVFRCLIEDYQTSSVRPFEEFAAPEAANIRSLWRRQLIEGHLRDCADKFSGQVEAEAIRDISVTWWYHTLVTCGDVAFTQNSAPNPDHVVRHSIFRERYAASNQRYFAGMEPEIPKVLRGAALPMYGILLHGCDPAFAGLLGFAVIRFPTPNLQSYDTARIDLFREFPDIAAEIATGGVDDIQEEQIDDLPDIELREEGETG